MRFAVGLARDNVEKRLEEKGINRRQFLKYCTAVAVAMGMGPAFAPEVAKALTGKRPSVVYLHNAECTGCTEAFLRSTNQFDVKNLSDAKSNLDVLLFDTISLDYQETVMAALLGVFLFNETMTALQVLGGVLIVGGGVFQIFFSTKKNQPAVEESAEGLAGMH